MEIHKSKTLYGGSTKTWDLCRQLFLFYFFIKIYNFKEKSFILKICFSKGLPQQKSLILIKETRSPGTVILKFLKIFLKDF